jgi:hypothetical protein
MPLPGNVGDGRGQHSHGLIHREALDFIGGQGPPGQ